VVASLLGKTSMLFPGSEVVDSKPTPLTKLILLKGYKVMRGGRLALGLNRKGNYKSINID
jgi:hypothetical protein